QMKQRVLQPLARSVSPQVNFEGRWETLQNRAAQKWIANHKPANETRDFTATAGLHRAEIASLQLGDHRRRQLGSCALRVAHLVSIAVRHDHYIARLQLYRRLVSETNYPRAFYQKMINQEVWRIRSKQRRQLTASWSVKAPRRRKLRVEIE